MRIGHRIWAIAKGFIPKGSTGPAPEMESHETACLLNAGAADANVEIMVFFADREPARPYRVTVPARRSRHVPFNELEEPEGIPRGTDFASVIQSEVPIVVQHTRLDSRQAAHALLSSLAFPAARRRPGAFRRGAIPKKERNMARIAVTLASEFEDSEYSRPVEALKKAGHELVVIGSKAGEKLTGKNGKTSATVDATAKDRKADEFDALLIPGGHSPDTLRIDKDIVAFVKKFFDADKPVAAVCHGPQLLIEARVVEGKTMTSWPSVKTDLINAGAKWVDREVVEDGKLVTSRKPDDLDAFTKSFLKQLDGAGRRPEVTANV